MYGVNNLSYLKEQIKGYDTDIDSDDDDGGGENSEEEELIDDDGMVIRITNNGTLSLESSLTANPNGNEIESSGDGEDGDELEDKSNYIPIPNNSDNMVSSQLQRLTQLVQKVNKNQNSDLTPDDLNQYLALHKLIHQKIPINIKAEPVPHNKLIEENHLKQILDLQKKLNNLGNTRDTYSTTPSPIKFTVNGNGVYPAEATTVHIKATNALKTPQLPSAGYSSSQIVINKPGGSVVFRLPHSGMPPTESTTKDKPENAISEDTLKTLLELTKHMANQAPNTPNFVHSLPSAATNYAQPYIQPILYNFPFDHLSLASLFEILNSKMGNKVQNVENDKESMEKIASTSFSVPTTPIAASEPDDTGQTTIVHNHIPITIAHPSPSSSIVNRFHPVTTTERPLQNQYDSYGYKKPSIEHTDLNNYYPYPPYPDKDPIMKPIPSTAATVLTYKSPFSTQPTAYDANVEQPQYIQIAQSRPDNYVPEYQSNNVIAMDGVRPIPTFASVNGGYTQKFYSTYTPQPHLNENNVNEVVHIKPKPYPTMSSAVNYVPIATASSATHSYAEPPEYGHVHKHPQIADKIDQFIDANEQSENDGNVSGGGGDGGGEYANNADYANTNLEQSSNENVMDLLANFNSRFKSNSNANSMESNTATSDTQSVSAEKKPTHKHKKIQSQGNHKQFVNLNGNFMTLETYQESIEPYLEKNSISNLQIEVLTCATGVRQANSTDCTRYFVCNEKTGRILSYSCPPYTAFNADTKICNGESYSRCFSNSPTKLSQSNTKLSVYEASRIKAEAIKAQQLAQLIKVETDKILNAAHQVQHKQQMAMGGKSTVLMIPPTRPAQVVQQRPNQIANRQPQPIHKRHKTQSKQKASVKNQQVHNTQGKRKIPCRSEGKLVDNLSQHHYFLCFKDQTKKMRARRLQCPANLMFCPTTLVCTATERCKLNRLWISRNKWIANFSSIKMTNRKRWRSK